MKLRRQRPGPQPHHCVHGPPVEMVLTRSCEEPPRRHWTLNIRSDDGALSPVADFRDDRALDDFYLAVQGKVWLTFGELHKRKSNPPTCPGCPYCA